MILLAIDTSGRQGSIALARAGEQSSREIDVIETASLAGGTFSAQLVPQIAALLAGHGFSKQDIGAFAVASGPGSFTGLRVGLSAVKALAEVLHKPIAAVSLLEACILTSRVQGKVMAALDAGRGDVYVGSGEISEHSVGEIQELILTKSEFIAQASGWKVVTPDSMIAEAVTAAGLPVSMLEPIAASTIARMGWSKIQRGETVAPDQLEANYIRRTDAEMLERIGS
jgi:tRNA threonylcarbamoyladenosine biosynthesis protein TsaB